MGGSVNFSAMTSVKLNTPLLVAVSVMESAVVPSILAVI
jgi:hypothetical protein